MSVIWNSAVALLLLTGGLLGLTLPFAKIAGGAGIPPAVWAFVISAGAGAILLTALLTRGNQPALHARKLRYFAITAAISYAFPSVLMFSAIPHLGAGYTGIMLALSPVITLLLSIVLGVRRPNRLGIAGIAVGFVGALVVTLTRGQAGQPASLWWVTIGLLIPLSLAAGNIYRTYDWPRGAGPIELAVGSHLTAALMLFILVAASGEVRSIVDLADVPLLTAAQVAASTGMFALFFRLQQVGGPVYLSQIGYVSAAVGLIASTLFLGEQYHALTWFGALIIAAGIAITTKAQVDADALASEGSALQPGKPSIAAQ